jgi:hypothetical protein
MRANYKNKPVIIGRQYDNGVLLGTGEYVRLDDPELTLEEDCAPATELPATFHVMHSDEWQVQPAKDGTFSIINRAGQPICHGFRDLTVAEAVARKGRKITARSGGADSQPQDGDF